MPEFSSSASSLQFFFWFGSPTMDDLKKGFFFCQLLANSNKGSSCCPMSVTETCSIEDQKSSDLLDTRLNNLPLGHSFGEQFGRKQMIETLKTNRLGLFQKCFFGSTNTTRLT